MGSNSIVMNSTAPNQRMAGGLDAIVKDLNIAPISQIDAKEILIPNHYLHSFPGGTKLSFGVYLDARLLGALTFGVGPYLGYKLVKDASPDDVVTLTRLWLSDDLPKNSESRVLGLVLR